MVRHAQAGILHLPLALLLLVISGASAGTIGFTKRLTGITRDQLRLDECVGKAASKLRDLMMTLHSTNLQMTALRATAAASTTLPPARAAAQAALMGIYIYQETRIATWLALQIAWNLPSYCKGKHDLSQPLPSLPYVRDPPDAIGPLPLRETSQPRLGIAILRSSGRRYALAKVEKNENGSRWQALWASLD